MVCHPQRKNTMFVSCYLQINELTFCLYMPFFLDQEVMLDMLAQSQHMRTGEKMRLKGKNTGDEYQYCLKNSQVQKEVYFQKCNEKNTRDKCKEQKHWNVKIVSFFGQIAALTKERVSWRKKLRSIIWQAIFKNPAMPTLSN